MGSFFKNRPLWITLIVVIILIVLIGTTSGSRNASFPESAAGSVLAPVENFINGITISVSHFFERIFVPSDAEKENETLQEQVLQLQEQVQQLEEAERENERLKGLLNSAENLQGYKPVVASITAMDPSNYFDMFTINAGRNQGIQKDMAVTDGYGVVGRIVEVGANYSKVMTIMDARSSISALVERTRDKGVVKGDAVLAKDAGLCQIYYLPFDTDLVPGDVIITSGMGGVFPKGMVIGEVAEVSRETSNSEKNATIKPAADFRHLEEVMVLVPEENPKSETSTEP